MKITPLHTTRTLTYIFDSAGKDIQELRLMIGENLQLIEKKMAKAVDGEIQVQVPQVVDGMHPLLVELIMEAVHRKVIIEDSNLISSTSIVLTSE